MFRSHNTRLILAAVLMVAAAGAMLAPSQALAGPPKGPHYVQSHYPHHYYGHHYGYPYGQLYVGPAVVLPAVPVAVSATPHTLFYLGADGSTRVYGTFMQIVYSNGATNMGGLLEAQSSLTGAGITNWIDAPPSAAAN